MRIAVTYEDGQVFQHFGHTREFKVYDVEDGEVRSAQVVETNGAGHGALAGVLSAQNPGVLICGGIGGGYSDLWRRLRRRGRGGGIVPSREAGL